MICSYNWTKQHNHTQVNKQSVHSLLTVSWLSLRLQVLKIRTQTCSLHGHQFKKSFIYVWQFCGATTHDMIGRSHKCKGHTGKRTASSQSPSFYNCLSGCSRVWAGRRSSCSCRWSCMPRWAPSHWSQYGLVDTILEERQIEFMWWLVRFIRGLKSFVTL